MRNARDFASKMESVFASNKHMLRMTICGLLSNVLATHLLAVPFRNILTFPVSFASQLSRPSRWTSITIRNGIPGQSIVARSSSRFSCIPYSCSLPSVPSVQAKQSISTDKTQMTGENAQPSQCYGKCGIFLNKLLHLISKNKMACPTELVERTITSLVKTKKHLKWIGIIFIKLISNYLKKELWVWKDNNRVRQ